MLNLYFGVGAPEICFNIRKQTVMGNDTKVQLNYETLSHKLSRPPSVGRSID